MSEPINALEIVRQYLIANGYDGLVDKEAECSCMLDDLMPCFGDAFTTCEAGHKLDCPEEYADEYEFCIKAGKRDGAKDGII